MISCVWRIDKVLTCKNMEPSAFERACGLKFSLSHLAEMRSKILTLTREEQAKYVDAVTEAKCSDPVWLSDQVSKMRSVDFTQTNTTSVGNLAYMALHGQLTDEERKRIDGLLQYFNDHGLA